MRTNFAFFIPHVGCPYKCSFCNQFIITDKKNIPHSKDIIKALDNIENKNLFINSEIAFFGGSFTAINQDYMIELLEAAYLYVENGVFKGIRISTRPDYINEQILDLLLKYKVTSIELGVQCLDDYVLSENNRGHTVQDVTDSVELIKKYPFELGLQIMPGLYKSNTNIDLKSEKKIIEYKPDTVRIYPTIILKNTKLEQLYRDGLYIPYSLEETVNLCSEMLYDFESNNIKVIKLGLHSGFNMDDGYVAGPFHPAFRELCESKIYLDIILKRLLNLEKGYYLIEVGRGCLSKALGQHKSNLKKLEDIGYKIDFSENNNLKYLEINILNKE